MLSSYTPVPTLPTSDLARTRDFYENTLGLTAQRDDLGSVSYTCGSGHLFIYESEFAGTNKATAVAFSVLQAEFDAEVGTLRAKGIEFISFENEGIEWNDGVASMGQAIRAVWFADPDGNILNFSAGQL